MATDEKQVPVLKTQVVEKAAPQPTLAQYLADQAGRRRNVLALTVHVSGAGKLTATLSPSGAEGEAITFEVVDNECRPG